MARPIHWEPLGGVAPSALSDVRQELHWLAQVVRTVGYRLADPKDDDSHTSTQWVADRRVFAGAPLRRDPALRVAWSPATFELQVLHDGRPVAARGFAGASLADAYGWVADQLGGASLEPDGDPPPDHPVATGAPFDPDPGHLAELERWYANADALLRAFRADTDHASPVRCWPHHFDIATLVALDPDKGTRAGPSVGVGLSPGDGGIDQPYLYVTPWPYPEHPDPPALPGAGTWNREGWFGAVLTAEAVVGAGPGATAQIEATSAHVAAAVAACRALLA